MSLHKVQANGRSVALRIVALLILRNDMGPKRPLIHHLMLKTPALLALYVFIHFHHDLLAAAVAVVSGPEQLLHVRSHSLEYAKGTDIDTATPPPSHTRQRIVYQHTTRPRPCFDGSSTWYCRQTPTNGANTDATLADLHMEREWLA